MSIHDKTTYFSELVSQVNTALDVHIDLEAKGHDSYRDALAFYVEQLFLLYAKDQSTQMMKGALEKIRNGSPIGVRQFLDEQITSLYEAFIAQKIAQSDDDKKKEWQDVAQIYAARRKANCQRYKDHKPVEFGGIRYDALPEWYVRRYVE